MAVTSNTFPSFTETLSEALDVVERMIADYRIKLSPEAEYELRETYSYGMRYGEILKANVPIETLKDRNTGKWFHVVITRLDSGRYEPISYPL